MIKGFSVLEVLLSIAIISLGLLGVIEWQLHAMRHINISQQQNLLEIALENLAAQLAVTSAASFTLKEWQQQLYLDFPNLQIQLHPENHDCWSVQLHWQQYQQSYSMEQRVCAAPPVSH